MILAGSGAVTDAIANEMDVIVALGVISLFLGTIVVSIVHPRAFL